MISPPNDVRFFVHKRLLRGVSRFVTSGFNPLAAAGAILAPAPPPRRRTGTGLVVPAAAPVTRTTRRTAPPSTTARPSVTSGLEKERGRNLKFPELSVGAPGGGRNIAAAAPCFPPFRMFEGSCVRPFLGNQPGPDDTPIGDPVMGRYGAGEVPGNMVVNRAVCRPGMVLGDDDVCYNRSQISNKERQWPRGRRPLLTGGDMRAISTAARAGKRLEGATKRLQKIGLMKKAAPRSRRPAVPTPAQIHHSHHD